MNRKLIYIIVIFIVTISIGIYIYLGNNYESNFYNLNMEKVNKYTNPPIPEGFKKVETDTASWELENGISKGWNNGLVIEDINGNQFVWVPCINSDNNKEVTLYSRYILDGEEYISKNEDFLFENSSSKWYFYESDLINKDIFNSISKYQGFYIGRYETGIDDGNLMSKEISQSSETYTGWENGKAIIKKNADVWNYITKNKAKELADNFIINNDTVSSSLITSLCWDTTIKWIESSIPKFSLNSNNYGNYDMPWSNYDEAINSNFTTFKSGTSEKYNTKNIYDMAGNVQEFTTEFAKNSSSGQNQDNQCVLRGRSDYNLGEFTFKNCSGRTPIYLTSSSPLIGFRIILYIK